MKQRKICTFGIRILIITLLYWHISTLSFSQVRDDGFPSPNAAALGKYADYPVSYFTGVPAINIPLYTLKDGAATLPMSLSYHASGIKVAEVASWVGLGWVLNAGGVITRTIKGAPDEGTKRTGGSLGPKGYYKDYGLSTLPPIKMEFGVGLPKFNMSEIVNEMFDKGTVDAESDLYTFNINGIIVGKFVFDEKRNPTFLTQSDAKINVDYSGGEFQRWNITTPDGVHYIFGENGARDINSINNSTDPDSKAHTAWYLTKIIYPNTTDSIVFEYTPERYSYFGLASELVSAIDFATLANTNPTNEDTIRYNLNGVNLSKIKSKNIVINFSSNSNRQDIMSGGHCLDKIQVINSINNQLIDEINFNYNYFQSSTYGTSQLDKIDASDRMRLKLLSIKKGISTAPIQNPLYLFEYYEDIHLPRRCNFDVDHWGYANDWGAHNNRFTPNTISEFKTYTLIKRKVDEYRYARWPFTQSFSLKKITDPLGVNTTFEFEPNNIVKDTIQGSALGGGLRIKRITIQDTITNQKQIRKFDYSSSTDNTKTSGVILRRPTYWCEVANEYRPNTVLVSPSCYFVGDLASVSTASFQYFLKYSQSPLPLQDYQGYSIGYRQVKELFGENAENGYKVYNYQVNANPTATTRLQSSNYAPGGSIYNTKFNEILPNNLKYSDPNNRGKFFPFEPEQVDLSAGLLLKEQIFNKNGKLLLGNDYTYEEKYYYNQWLRGFIGFRRVVGSPPIYIFPYAWYALTYYSYRTGIARLLSQKTTVLDSLSGKTATTEVKYAYESPNHLQPTRQTTINNGIDSSENIIRYSFDFDTTAISGGVINEMKKQNILSPLRVETWENGTLSNCSSTEYAKNTVGAKTTVVPIKTYVLKTKKNLSSADAGFTKAFTATTTNLNGSSALMKLQGFYSYNNAGLLQQQAKVGDIPTSYIWDYNNTIPIAVVSNAAPADIAYTSFEADGAGGWSITVADRVNIEAFTGNKCYDLSKGNITKTALNSSKTYVVSYWAKTGANVSITNATQTIQGPTENNWTLWTKKVTGTTTTTISGSGTIDELRLYPDKAQMKSSTYTPGMGITSSVDENNNISIYEYDELNRLKVLRDGYRNIVKTYCYNYAGAPISCDGVLFYNTALSQPFKRNNCGAGYIAGSVNYSVPANKYSSIISQADANNKAQIDINTNGQNYANSNGTCTAVYAQLSYENVNTDWVNYEYADVVVRFYADAACTTPLTVTNLPIAIQFDYHDGVGGSTSTEYDYVANGNYFYVDKGAQLMNKIELTDQGTPSGNYVTVTADYTLKDNTYYIITP